MVVVAIAAAEMLASDGVLAVQLPCHDAATVAPPGPHPRLWNAWGLPTILHSAWPAVPPAHPALTTHVLYVDLRCVVELHCFSLAALLVPLAPTQAQRPAAAGCGDGRLRRNRDGSAGRSEGRWRMSVQQTTSMHARARKRVYCETIDFVWKKAKQEKCLFFFWQLLQQHCHEANVPALRSAFQTCSKEGATKRGVAVTPLIKPLVYMQ